MKDLIIETSLRDVALGIYIQGEELFQKKIEKGRGEILSDLLAEGLRESHSTMDEIKRVLITLGPGSFTGLRVGLAFAQGLCFSGKRELFTVSTLAALATGVRSDSKNIIICRSKPGIYYVGVRDANEPLSKALSTEVLMTTEELLAFVQPHHHLLIDTEMEAELLAKLSAESVQDLWAEFSLKNYALFFGVLGPVAVDKAVPNYIQEPYAK
ncbi:MAG: tRNA (adenosine(37)-N6)-threonylcarbamoyltransferase complex dimerization subunit type 1 TsaB [Fibrobacterales bacterium]